MCDVFPRARASPDAVPAALSPLHILYVDDWLVALHKPAGLFMHRTDIDRRATDFVLQGARELLDGRHLYPVHRLDRGASGLVVFARSVEAQRAMAGSFAQREVDKSYLAIVRGWPAASGHIDAPLARLDGDGNRRIDVEAQASLTHYERLGAAELPVAVGRYPSSRYALVLARPHTGRRHQIRRHLRRIDHPLIGDTTYGVGAHNRFFRDHYGIHRLLLAAVELQMPHPASGAPLRLRAPCSDDFWRAVVALGLEACVPMPWHPSSNSI